MEQEIIECPCGSIIKKGQLSRHTRTRKHLNHLEKVKKKRSTLDLTKSDLHNNIKAFLDGDVSLHDSYLFDYSFNGVVHECPVFDVSSMFTLSEI